jgi:hypothetical protein
LVDAAKSPPLAAANREPAEAKKALAAPSDASAGDAQGDENAPARKVQAREVQGCPRQGIG